ncbi:glycoside hydrolase domain-containing protein [Streptomyces sp. NPDC057565]|uniref:glycoside hydrolase domain-containing protein n=1 Tax=Streptomyces sp. NPDC057565 TaxID=3346169 RepID=UPI003681306E
MTTHTQESVVAADPAPSPAAHREGVDYSDRHTAAEVKAMNAEFVVRYLSPNTSGHPSKQLTNQERQALHALGIAVGFVWESTGSRAAEDYQAGVDDAKAAQKQLRKLGAPDNSVVYFAVDFDTAGDPGQVDEYFRGVTETFGLANTGVYGGYEAVEHLHEKKQIPWMWQTASWSHKKWYAAAQLQQYSIDAPPGFDLDRTTVAEAGLWEPVSSPNRRVEGRIVDAKGNGVEALAVGVFRQELHGERLMPDVYSSQGEAFHGYARTAFGGTFTVGYDGGVDDLVVRVFSSVGRQLGPDHGPYPDVKDKLVLPPIQVAAAELKGRVSTTGAFTQSVNGNAVEPLIDNDAAWKALYDDVLKAEHSIDWMLFFLDVGRVFMTFDDPTPDTGVTTTGGRLEDALKKVAQDKGVKVRLACNQLTAHTAFSIPWPFTTASQVTRAMKDVSNVKVRTLRTPATAPIHAKFVVIDNKIAYLIGSPFVSDYYDGITHAIGDARHGDFSSCIDSRAIKVPTHDVSMRLRGPVIGQLNETFALHWNQADPDAPEEPPAPAPPAVGTTSLQVVRSLAGNARYTASPHGEKTVLESYLRAIETAKKYIYFENQYFTNDVIAEAIVRRLKERTELCVIFLTNNKVDIPSYDVLHPQHVGRVLSSLEDDERRRVGFFCPWSHESGATAQSLTEICRNYIHSKVAIIDDDWITVGSANLDGASLDYSQNPYTNWFATWLFGLRPKGDLHENRETEVNVSLFDQVSGGPATTIARDARRRLWAEHLGYASPTHADLQSPPSGGDWLKLWRTRAEAKLAGLTASRITIHSAKVLAYPPEPGTTKISDDADSAEGYLKWAGVKVDALNVREHFRRFDWKHGQWEDNAS